MLSRPAGWPLATEAFQFRVETLLLHSALFEITWANMRPNG